MFKSFLKKLKKETSVVNTDKFDKRRFNQIYEMSKGLQELKKEEEIPMYKELLGDMWASLYKMNPELKHDDDIGEHLQPNKQLIERMIGEESYQDYREKTRLDDMLSAIGTMKYGEKTHQWLQEQREKDQELDKQMKKVQQLAKQHQKENKNNPSQDSNNDGEGQGDGQQDLSQTEQGLNQAMSDLSQQLSQSLNTDGDSFSQAMNQAAEETKETNENLNSLFGGAEAGSGRGELQNMPLRQKIELAETLSSDEKLKDIAKWAGKYTKIARTKQKSKHKESTEQSGIEQGNNIEKVLPSELVQYINPKTKNDFLKRYAEGQLMQYEQKGRESLGEGSIVVCLDQSGSMEDLENQSKGFTLALMAIAKKQKRNFAYIPFDSHVGKVRQFPKGRIKPNEMVEVAREFLSGGTNFEHPLNSALKIIRRDTFKDADVVFVTDGHAGISGTFLNVFNETKEKEKFNVLSLAIGNGNTSSLERFSDKVITINNFDDEGTFQAFEI